MINQFPNTWRLAQRQLLSLSTIDQTETRLARMQIGKVMGRQVYTNTGKELEMLRRFSERMIDEIYRGKISLSQANSSSCIGGHSLHNNESAFYINE